MPRVSVVIPSYNMARFLPAAVESVLHQTYRDFELIVIDDGSIDNTAEIVRQFPATVRYYRQENGGVSAARNRGIELTKGEYITFFDADDIMLEDALQKSVAFLDQHPEVGFCYGQVYKIDEDGRQMRMRSLRGAKHTCVREGKEQITRMLFRGDISPSAVVTRRSCLNEVGFFDTSIRMGEDIDLWLRLSRRYSVGYIAEPLAKYRVHLNSITGRRSFKALKDFQTAFLQHALEGLESEPYYRSLKRKTYSGLYCYLSEEAAHGGQRTTGFRYILKAIQTCPELLLQKDGAFFLMSVAGGFLPKWFRKLSKRTLIALKPG